MSLMTQSSWKGWVQMRKRPRLMSLMTELVSPVMLKLAKIMGLSLVDQSTLMTIIPKTMS